MYTCSLLTAMTGNLSLFFYTCTFIVMFMNLSLFFYQCIVIGCSVVLRLLTSLVNSIVKIGRQRIMMIYYDVGLIVQVFFRKNFQRGQNQIFKK